MLKEKERFIPFTIEEKEPHILVEKSEALYNEMKKRRSIRHFSEQSFPKEVIENIIKIASTSPSGANKQPWNFCVVSNKDLKHLIRDKAEEEEYLSYNGRMGDDWLNHLKPFGTNHIKEFIDIAPYVIVVFKKIYDIENNKKVRYNNYYVNESVGIATGFLLSAIHQIGLAALTHTPSPMNFLQKALERPENERAFMLIPVGYPCKDATVPNIKRKGLNEVAKFYD